MSWSFSTAAIEVISARTKCRWNKGSLEKALWWKVSQHPHWNSLLLSDSVLWNCTQGSSFLLTKTFFQIIQKDVILTDIFRLAPYYTELTSSGTGGGFLDIFTRVFRHLPTELLFLLSLCFVWYCVAWYRCHFCKNMASYCHLQDIVEPIQKTFWNTKISKWLYYFLIIILIFWKVCILQ